MEKSLFGMVANEELRLPHERWVLSKMGITKKKKRVPAVLSKVLESFAKRDNPIAALQVLLGLASKSDIVGMRVS